MGNEETTAEEHLTKLHKLHGWLKRNPNNSQLVEQEANAVEWAINQLEEKK